MAPPRLLQLAAVVAMVASCCCCFIHTLPTIGAAAVDASHLPSELEVVVVVVQQDTRAVAPPTSSFGSADDDQAVDVDGEVAVGRERMDLELEDYPGSGANDRHSPWAAQQQRRN